MSHADDRPRGSPLAGIGLMLLGILLFVLNDLIGKWLLTTYGVGQVLLIRSIAALIVLAPLIQRAGWRHVAMPAQPGYQLLRVLFATLEVSCFYWAVAYLPLADVVTFYLAGPIWVTALAGPLLGEINGWRRWTAVLVGFVGVVIAMRPTSAALGLPAIVALGGSFFFALLMIITRKVRGSDDITLVTWTTTGALLMGLVTAPWTWVTPGPRDLLLLALLGVVALGGHMCVNRSLKLAPAAVVVPYQYTQIVWAVLFGWIVFGDVPELGIYVGSGIIVAAGLYIFMREQTLSRRPKT